MTNAATSRSATGSRSNVRYLPAPRRQTPTLAPEAVAFQSDACAVEHAPVPWAARSMVWFLLLVIATAVGWACVAKLDRVVATTGRIITPVPKLVVQPLETSSIRRINVEPGQTVKKGDVLAELDATFAQADQAQLEKRRELLEARIARLRAEVTDTDFTVASDAGSDYLVQQALFAQRRRERDMKITSLDQQLAQIEAALAGTRTSAGLLENQLELARELEQMRGKLAVNGNVSRSVLLELRQHRLEVEVSQKAATDRMIELSHQAEALHAQHAGFLEEWHRTAARAAYHGADGARRHRRAGSEGRAQIELGAAAGTRGLGGPGGRRPVDRGCGPGGRYPCSPWCRWAPDWRPRSRSTPPMSATWRWTTMCV